MNITLRIVSPPWSSPEPRPPAWWPPPPASTLGKVPSCVSVWQKTGTAHKTGYAYNGCGRRLNMKIVWAHGSDGACHSVAPKGTIWSTVPRGIRTFDGAKYC